MRSRSETGGNESPLFRALGIPPMDDSAAELRYCRTIIQAHLRKKKLSYKVIDVLVDIVTDIECAIDY